MSGTESFGCELQSGAFWKAFTRNAKDFRNNSAVSFIDGHFGVSNPDVLCPVRYR
jgi:hypothetical protein